MTRWHLIALVGLVLLLAQIVHPLGPVALFAGVVLLVWGYDGVLVTRPARRALRDRRRRARRRRGYVTGVR